MPSSLNILIASGASLAWMLMGLPIALRLLPRLPALTVAPVLGWAVHNVLALPLFGLIGMSRTSVAGLVALLVLLAIVALGVMSSRGAAVARTPGAAPIGLALLGAALLAVVPMQALLPTVTADGVSLAQQIFDHTKIAMVEEMARNGVPPVNPFFADAGEPVRLTYYYLWHFSAAQLSLLTGVSGWEADASLTWFTAFASLSLMIGVARWLSGSVWAATWVLALAATGSLRRPVEWVLGEARVAALLEGPGGFGGWLSQSAWAPQHVAAAGCVVVAILLIAELARRPSLLGAIVLALVAAAGFESSSWVGGVTFGAAAAVVGFSMLWTLPQMQRRSFVGYASLAAVIAIAIAMPLAYQQWQLSAARAGSPVGFAIYPVLGGAFPGSVRTLLDPLAYWLLFLPVEFPAFFPAGMAVLIVMLSKPDRSLVARQSLLALAGLLAASLCLTWLLASRLGDNNDLGWRAVLPAILLLIAFAAAGLARWFSLRRASSLAAGALAALGLVGGVLLAWGYCFPPRPASAKIFAETPAMWEAVRRHAGPAERVINNPYFLQDMTPWPGNLSWALLSDRRSCYASPDLVAPFARMSAERLKQFDTRFKRIFAGHPTDGDLRALVGEHGCRIILVAAQDGAWARDPFASNPRFHLLESKADAWRIYRAVD